MNDLGFLPPQAQEIEIAILGILLLDNRCVSENIDNIQEEYFYNQIHRTIFHCIKEMYKKGKDIDILTLTEYLKEKNKLNEIGGPYFISSLTSRVASSGHIESWIVILHEAYVKRELLSISNKITSNIYSNRDCFEVMDDITKSLSNLYSNSENNVLTFKEALGNLTEQIKRNYNSESSITGISTGFKKYDERSGGLQPGNLIIIAGEPSQGKTSLAMNFAFNGVRTVNEATKENFKCAFYSLEMTNTELASRILAMESGISASDILYKKLYREELDQITVITDKIENTQIYLDDKSNSNLDNIIVSIKNMVLKYHINFAIVDYIQLCSVSTKGASKEQIASEVTKRLKNTAKELNINIIALSQLNRVPENPEPKLSRLRDSGQIAADADVVILVYRPEYYNRNFPEPFCDVPTANKAMIDVAKGRSIGVFKFICDFDCNTTRFYDSNTFSSGQLQPNPNFDKEEECPY